MQPIQRVRAEQDHNQIVSRRFDFESKKFVQLANETMEGMSASNDGRYAIGSDNRKYRVDYAITRSGLQRLLSDQYHRRFA